LIDSTKAKIDAIHKRILIFLGVGAGSWATLLEFAKTENIYLQILSILFFMVFVFGIIGTLTALSRLSQAENRLKDLQEKLYDILRNYD
jgi:sorbitol-specific phosphotransferase system component IIBC